MKELFGRTQTLHVGDCEKPKMTRTKSSDKFECWNHDMEAHGERCVEQNGDFVKSRCKHCTVHHGTFPALAHSTTRILSAEFHFSAWLNLKFNFERRPQLQVCLPWKKVSCIQRDLHPSLAWVDTSTHYTDTLHMDTALDFDGKLQWPVRALPLNTDACLSYRTRRLRKFGSPTSNSMTRPRTILCLVEGDSGMSSISSSSTCSVTGVELPQQPSQILTPWIQHREIGCDKKSANTGSLQEESGAQENNKTWETIGPHCKHTGHDLFIIGDGHEKRLVQPKRDAQSELRAEASTLAAPTSTVRKVSVTPTFFKFGSN